MATAIYNIVGEHVNQDHSDQILYALSELRNAPLDHPGDAPKPTQESVDYASLLIKRLSVLGSVPKADSIDPLNGGVRIVWSTPSGRNVRLCLSSEATRNYIYSGEVEEGYPVNDKLIREVNSLSLASELSRLAIV